MTVKDLFMLFLILEARKREKSKLRYYIKSVPKLYTTISSVKVEEFKFLPPYICAEIKDQIETINKHFQRIQSTVNGTYDKLLIKEVRWAWNVLNTRSVYFCPSLLKSSKEVCTATIDFALAPVLDMLNHSFEAEVLY